MHACMQRCVLYSPPKGVTVQWVCKLRHTGILADSIKFMIHHETEMRDGISKRTREKDDVPFGSVVATGERSSNQKDKKSRKLEPVKPLQKASL